MAIFNFKISLLGRIAMPKCTIFVFSGTGNTLLVVKKMAEVFRENNIDVNLMRIEKASPVEINRDHELCLHLRLIISDELISHFYFI